MLDLDIREQMSRYVDGQTARTAFEDWFYVATWDVEGEGPSARHLTFAVMRLLAERDHGDWTEAELKALLRPLISTYRVDLANTEIATSASDITETCGPPMPGEAGRSLAAASV
jgi:hypothetical protein